MLVSKWYIRDWAGNIMFQNETWPSFDDAEKYLSNFLTDDYETDRGEYFICPMD